MPAVLEYHNVSYAYHRTAPVLANISLAITAGEFVAIIGRNGTGKTTFTRLAMGLLRPTGGHIKVLGRDIAALSTGDIARSIGYIMQNPDRQLFLDTVEKEVAYGPVNLGCNRQQVSERVEAALLATGLQNVRCDYPRTLPRSVKQRVALASVFAMDPAALILDEPTSGQDAQEKNDFMALVQQQHLQGKTIVLVIHDMDTVARYAQRCILLGDGGVAFDGTPSDLFMREQLLQHYGITAPLAARLSLRLAPMGMPFSLTMAEFLPRLAELTGIPDKSCVVRGESM